MKESNIEMERDHDHFVMFKTTCDCGSNRHAVRVIVDDMDNECLMASLYYECGWADHWNDPWWKKMWRRIRDASRILFKGELFLDEEFIFRSDGHLQDFLRTLQDAVEQIAEKRKSFEKKVDSGSEPS